MSEAAERMRQTYKVSGDKWFRIAAEEIYRLEAVQLAAARFRSAVIGSGALNHVLQDKYMDELRALEQALAATTLPVTGGMGNPATK